MTSDRACPTLRGAQKRAVTGHLAEDLSRWFAAGVDNMTVPSAPNAVVTDVDAVLTAQGDRTYREFLRVPALSLGLFAAPPKHTDTQQPHEEDEVYLVLAGRAVLEIAGARHPVGPGSVAYVPARVPHRFVEISDELRVVVVFAPAESSPSP